MKTSSQAALIQNGRVFCEPPSVCYTQLHDRPDTDYSTSNVVNLLVVHLGPVLIVLGTGGNVMAAIVVTRSKLLWKRTASLYILVLAMVDTITLVMGLGDYLLYVNGIHIRTMNHISCRLLIFRFYFLKMLEAWILVNMNLERLWAVFLPHKVKILFTKRRAGIGLLVTTFGVLALNLVYIPTFELSEENYCQVKTKYNELMKIWYWVDLGLASAFPFLVMTSCSFAIVINIVHARRKWNHVKTLSYGKISSMTVSMLLIAICFLLLTAPLNILSPMLSVYHEHERNEHTSKYASIFHFFNFFLYVNYVINFYIYCVSNPTFRQEFAAIICLQNKNKNPAMVFPMGTRTESSQTEDNFVMESKEASIGTLVLDS